MRRVIDGRRLRRYGREGGRASHTSRDPRKRPLFHCASGGKGSCDGPLAVGLSHERVCGLLSEAPSLGTAAALRNDAAGRMAVCACTGLARTAEKVAQ